MTKRTGATPPKRSTPRRSTTAPKSSTSRKPTSSPRPSSRKPTSRVDSTQKKLKTAHTNANRSINNTQRNANKLHNKADRQVDRGQNFASQFHDKADRTTNSVQRKLDSGHRQADQAVDRGQQQLRQSHNAADRQVDRGQSTANLAHTVGDIVVDQLQSQVPSWLPGSGLFNKGVDVVQHSARSTHREVDRRVNNTQQQLNNAHDQADRVVDQGQQDLNRAHDRADQAIDRGQQQLNQAHQKADQAIDNTQQTLDQVHQKADRIIDQGQAIADVTHAAVDAGVDKIQELTDVERQITQNLKRDGDNFTLGAGGNVSAELKGALNGQVQVSRVGDGDNPQYRITAGGEGAFGVVAPTNVKLGGTLGLDAEALGKLGGNVEFDFANAADAAKGTRILAQTGLAHSARAAGGLPGQALGQLADISPEDRKFLMDHVSAISFNGGGVGEAVARLGVPLDDNLKLGGASAGAGVEQKYTGRFQLPVTDPSGKVTQGPRFTFSNSMEGQLSGGLGLGFSKNGGDDLVRTGGIGSGKVSGNLTTSHTFELPNDLTAQSFFQDPSAALQNLATNTKPVDTSAKLTFQGVRGLGGNSQGRELSTQLGINPNQLLQSGFADQLFSGDPMAAIGTLGDHVKFNTTDRSFETRGLKTSPEIGIAGIGVGADLQATRENTISQTSQEFTASQLVDQLRTAFGQ